MYSLVMLKTTVAHAQSQCYTRASEDLSMLNGGDDSTDLGYGPASYRSRWLSNRRPE